MTITVFGLQYTKDNLLIKKIPNVANSRVNSPHKLFSQIFPLSKIGLKFQTNSPLGKITPALWAAKEKPRFVLD